MDDNTPQLWDAIWDKQISATEDRLALKRERDSSRWGQMRERLGEGLNGLRVVELGAGAGTYAALCADAGAQSTVVDYSTKGLERARAFFAHNGLMVNCVQADLRTLPAALHGTFDVAMSFGVAEHFRGTERRDVCAAHLQALKPGGLAFISVPNAWNPPYRIWKAANELTGRWSLGVEIPFTRSELRAICRELGVREYVFFGDAFADSWEYVRSFKVVRRLFPHDQASSTPRREVHWYDQYFSYALVLCARKPV